MGIQTYFAEFTRFNHEKDDYETARALLVADDGGNLVLRTDHEAAIKELTYLLNLYRTQHYRKWNISPLEACQCELCLRADAALKEK